MMKKKGQRVTACVVVIGNEILSGRTQDQNIAYIGRRCDELGIELAECRIIPDVTEAIITAVDACRRQYDYVFTTGGIGPTHDDITTAAVARLYERKIERNAAALTALGSYYGKDRLNDARLKMADIPVGASLIDNPISGAPGFQIENVFVLPGVPLIMQAMFEGITDRLIGGDPILTGCVITNLTEGTLAEGLSQVQDRYPRVVIGSYPFFKQGKLGVNLVMRTTDDSLLAAVAAAIRQLIQDLGGDVLN